VLDTDIAALDRRAAADFRGANLGFIFQDFNLIPVLTAYENIEYPLLMVQDWEAQKRRARVSELLAAVGMADQAGKRPDQLSGGQKQRVALARAFVSDPKLLLLDDPLSAVDARTEKAILEAIDRQRAQRGVILITHRVAAASRCDRILVLDHGRVVEQGTHDELVRSGGLYAAFAEEQRIERELAKLGAEELPPELEAAPA
jgi:ABC-type multidrug transport system fused ATPase/permease subunit